MKKILNIFISISIFACMAVTLSCCASKSKVNAKDASKEEFVKEYSLADLAAFYGFKMGGVIGNETITNQKYLNLLKNDFNSITASNEFKAYSLLNQAASMAQNKPVMRYGNADMIAKFAQENGIKIRGHVLVWDAYMPSWFFREGFSGNGMFVDRETMKERLQYYIDEVVTHFETNFPGVVYCWDVVNEAVADGSNEFAGGDPRHVRVSRGGTSNYFYEVIGPDYVEFAFKCARETCNKLNADIKLFYNDYNAFMSYKLPAICELVKSINAEAKLCDGVGMQGYIGGYGTQNGCMNAADIFGVQDAIMKYAALGVEVQITEMAIRNYNGDEATAAQHAKFYGKFFDMLCKINRPDFAPLTCVAIWGLVDNPSLPKDNYSYKQNGPYCGLYDWRLNYKDSFKQVYNVMLQR